jgi:ABC-type multidrug transport system ATPase subunit
VGAALAVETWDLTKTFRGRWPDDNLTWADAIVHGVKCLLRPPDVRTVVDRISLAVKAGEFFGIIGANGAGKTTLLKLLACLVYPDAGGGRVNGHDLRRERTAVRRSVGVAPAASYMGMLWQLTARENLLCRARPPRGGGARAP